MIYHGWSPTFRRHTADRLSQSILKRLSLRGVYLAHEERRGKFSTLAYRLERNGENSTILDWTPVDHPLDGEMICALSFSEMDDSLLAQYVEYLARKADQLAAELRATCRLGAALDELTETLRERT